MGEFMLKSKVPTKCWEQLTKQEIESYLEKADYLLDRGYVYGLETEELARKIFEETGLQHINF